MDENNFLTYPSDWAFIRLNRIESYNCYKEKLNPITVTNLEIIQNKCTRYKSTDNDKINAHITKIS
jgi:hypothetical protein